MKRLPFALSALVITGVGLAQAAETPRHALTCYTKTTDALEIDDGEPRKFTGVTGYPMANRYVNVELAFRESQFGGGAIEVSFNNEAALNLAFSSLKTTLTSS